MKASVVVLFASIVLGAASVSENFLGETYLEEEEEEPEYDPTIITGRMKDLDDVKNSQYQVDFDAAAAAKEEYEEAQEKYEGGKTAEKLEEAEKFYKKVKQRPNSDSTGHDALVSAQADYDAAKAKDEQEQKKVDDLQEKYERLQKLSYAKQYKAHILDLFDIKHRKGLPTYREALKWQVMNMMGIFNYVTFDSKSGNEDIAEFMKHLKETVHFYGMLAKETSVAAERKEHLRCQKVGTALLEFLQKKIDGQDIKETAFNVAIAKYNVESNRQSRKEALIMAKTLRGAEKVKAKAYAHFCKINQYQVDKDLKKVQPVGSDNTSLLISIFLGIVIIYFIYDIITCMKEDREKYQ